MDEGKTSSGNEENHPVEEKQLTKPIVEIDKASDTDLAKVEVSTADVSTGNKEGKQDSIDKAHLHYEDGLCIYTEPESKCQYIWDEDKQEWIPRSGTSFSEKQYEFDGKSYTYTDEDTNIKYAWDADKNEWKPIESTSNPDTLKNDKTEVDEDGQKEDGSESKHKEITKQDMSKGQYGFENDTHTYTDPSDGSTYFWDKEKNAWFPKVDDDFLAQYQMNYGFVDPNENQPKVEEKKPDDPPPEETLKRKAPQEPAWFDVGEESTKVYVSGLPLDITESEFVEVMQKCGLVMRDVDSGKMKVKIYLDPHNSLPKGDALCTYIKKESVDLALNLLDGYDVRGHRITVERAKFTMKGNAYDPSLKPKKKRKKDKEKMKKIQEKLFDWRPDKMRGERSKHENIVIIKNLFDPAEFNKDVKLILEYQQDLREECLKCGSVKKIIIYDRHAEGVAQVSFKEVEAADACVQLLNGRWFGQRKITAETWDGKTKYKISETDEQIKSRIAKWEKFLESGEAAAEEERRAKIAQDNVDKKDESVKEEVSEEVKDKADKDKDQENADSDGTRSSVESDYDTDDETKAS